ncbi:hypothetical protein DENIS_3017 [Desulfonema ishimotonii]|uniref:PilZ domain-containing protein n=1 Tax=Desulfonema ishimotonii TaxID=45657 RepID=A0A401FYM1_9BACT|nr:PilZ domain-containing protein [Desulfonema ishimotonii]GBC62054.1 hypothetical protein DENIS_3017 [Desulfonema ishimotonii]
MKDDRKNKTQLIRELEEMRARVSVLEAENAELKAGSDNSVTNMAQRSARKEIRTHIEFIADFDVIEARAVNISDGGISFETDEDLPFEMRFEMSGQPHYHRASLVWVKRLPDGGYRFGLMFTRPEAFPAF